MGRTRDQDRGYQRDRRLRIAAEQHDAAAGTAAVDPESTVARVSAELASLPQAAGMPAAVAVALAMARVLDNPAAVPQHPAAAGQLRAIMADLRGVQVPAERDTLARLRSETQRFRQRGGSAS